MVRRALVIAGAAAAMLVPALPAGAGGFCTSADSFQDGVTNEVVMKNDCFGPTVARVEVGDEVVFRNVDGHEHGVGGVAGSFGDPHKPVPPGGDIAFRFEEEGIYPYFCVFHPGMAGAIVVGDGEGTSAAGGGAGVPVDPAAAAAEKAGPVGGRLLTAMYVANAGLVVALGVAGVMVFRRRRALGAAA